MSEQKSVGDVNDTRQRSSQLLAVIGNRNGLRRLLDNIKNHVMIGIWQSMGMHGFGLTRLVNGGSDYMLELDNLGDSPSTSLFQGFEASVAALQNTAHESEIKGTSETSALTPNYIASLQDITDLRNLNSALVERLNTLKISKSLVSSEINDLDLRIKDLRLRRDSLVKMRADLERGGYHLKNQKHMIETRTRYLEKYEIGQVKNGGSVTTVDTLDEASEVEDRSIMAKSQNASNQNLYNFFQNYNEKIHITPTSRTHNHEEGTRICTLNYEKKEDIKSLDFDYDKGTLCSSALLDHSVKVWDLSKKSQVATLEGHLATINCLKMSASYNMVVTGGKDALLKLWNLNTAIQNETQNDGSTSSEGMVVMDPCVYTFEAHLDEITALSFDKDTLVSGSQDKTIKQWDLHTGKCIQTLDMSFVGNLTKSTMVAEFQDYQLRGADIVDTIQCFHTALATGTKDGVIRLWDLRSGQVVRTLQSHIGPITGLGFDAHNVISGSLDKSVKVWDLRTGLLVDAYAYNHPVLSLAFDANHIVSCTGESTIKIFDRHDGRHWECADEDAVKPINVIQYKNGAIADGRIDGEMNLWAL